MVEIQEYVDARGHIPYRDWLNKLDISARVRIITAVLRMQDGNFSNAKSVGSGVTELRLSFGPGYRVYFGKDGEQLVLLLTGGNKKRQQNDIATAHTLWTEYKERQAKGDKDASHKKLSRDDQGTASRPGVPPRVPPRSRK